jgi:phosphoserine phosphatase
MRMSPTAKRLVSFDLDGTLFPDTTTCLELGRHLGHFERIRELEARYARFEISNTDVAEQIAEDYRDQDIATVEQAVLGIPLIGGFQETIRVLKAHNIHILIVTVTGSFAARALVREYGLDGYAGATMGEDNGRFTGRIERHFEESEKIAYIRNFAAGHGFDLQRCVAVGDSRSDIPLFRNVGLAIALNATAPARAAANVYLDTDNLTDILPHIVLG